MQHIYLNTQVNTVAYELSVLIRSIHPDLGPELQCLLKVKEVKY